MEQLNLNDYKVLMGAIQSISIKGSDAIYMASLINKLQNQVNRLEIEAQENIKLDLPELEKEPKPKK